MLILCVLVAGAMVATLRIFLRKLRRIEEDMWGEKARDVDRARKKTEHGR